MSSWCIESLFKIVCAHIGNFCRWIERTPAANVSDICHCSHRTSGRNMNAYCSIIFQHWDSRGWCIAPRKIAEYAYKCPNSKYDMLVNEARTPTNYLAFVPFTSPYGHNQCLLALTVPGQHHLHNCMYCVHWNTLPSLSVNKFCVCVTNFFVETEKLHTQWFDNSRYMNKNDHHINAWPFVNCEFTTTHFSDGEIHTNWYY